jgi:hypothetical protein
MKKIYKVLVEFQEVRITHVFREANRCADMLANMGCSNTDNIIYFEYPPAEVIQIVDDDYRGVSFPVSFLCNLLPWAYAPLNTKKKSIYKIKWI